MFPGATADRSAAAYAVVGAPLDRSTSFQPGARFGPDRVRRFARSFEDYDRRTGRHFSDLGVHDAGNVRAWNDVREYLDYLAGTLEDLRREDAIPLVLGGEHTVSVAGVEAVDPDVFVALDAHLDLRESYDGTPWSHACVARRALKTADRAVILGARAGSEAEWERAEREDVTVVPPEAVGEGTAEGGASADPDPLPGTELDLAGRSVYLSVDVDAADPGFAPGTGTMEPFGLAPRQLRAVVRAVAPHAEGFDVVEVNDRDDGQAAALAAKLLRTFVREHAEAARWSPGPE